MVHLSHLKSETFPTSLIYYKIKARIKHQCPGQYMIHWQHHEIVVGKLLPRSRSTTTLPAQTDHVTCVCPHSFLNCRQHILRIHQAYFERNKKKVLYKYEILSFCITDQPKPVSTIRMDVVWLSSIWFPISSNVPQFLPREWTHPHSQIMCFGGGKGLSAWPSWWIPATQMGTQCKQSQRATKTLKETFSGNARYRQMVFCRIHSCEDVKVKEQLGTTKGENTGKSPHRRAGNGKRQWLPRAIFWARHRVLLKRPDYTSWLTPFYDVRRFEAGFAILTIKRATNCQNFYFDPFHELLTLWMNIILRVI